ncbi:Putative RNA-binding protein [Desulfonema limicola]|uniref:RNA-binding protein n=1 Tax=Desulfonema limicola TaxID=45656 RepID=A0A975BC56_9BACT|nr:Tex family protein [Desulfonema limicola]QTA82550.1 Putative RNA-binding protein [Desulfonema limicola]
MNQAHIAKIVKELNVNESQIQAVADLLEQGSTIPFIARYRKEATGSLDEVVVTAVRDRLSQLKELDSRKETILKSLEQNGHLTDQLKESVESAETMTVLEDIYLPYKPKKRTKATIAKEKGLEPLACSLLEQDGTYSDEYAANFIDPEKGVDSLEDALTGARHIIAETINEDPEARFRMRNLYLNKGVFKCSVAAGRETEGVKYKDYFDWEEPVNLAPSHRILAMRRGEKEDILNLNISPPEDEAVDILKNLFIKGEGPDSRQVELAVLDCYKRLMSRSMETETRLAAKERADAEAIRVFAENLRELLLSPPLGAKRVMGVDPGFRTGCKVICLDRQGKLLHNDTIYLHQPEKAAITIKKMCKDYKVEAIAIGNGTASRETEAFFKEISLSDEINIIVVNESGASVYSASEVAREEFPDYDLTVRGSVSIARRLMDPLSELVKIDPKSIGVGQYQHDVDQTALKQSLDDVVISCVNKVGVDLNRASFPLLTYVSGLGPQLAKNIVAYRDENGSFKSRTELKKVKRLGPKAFEQCAGFLRINNGPNPLDASAVHPESYHIVKQMAKDMDCTVSDLMKLDDLRKQIDVNKYVTDTIGIPTLKDILDELAKPGRDPREKFEIFSFASGIEKPEDLRNGMILPGIVTNVTAFGAFIDIGVHQDGLVHISELADRFVKDPADVVKIHQKVNVTVLDVDLERKRISLSMKSGAKPASETKSEQRRTPKPDKKISVHKKQKQDQNKPFNNPFADILGKM